MAASVEPLLPYIKPDWIGVEIGVAEGDSAVALFGHGVKFLYMIDPWAPYPEDGRADFHEERFRQALERTTPHCGRRAHLRMTSAEAARFVPPQLDFVWIDGNHQYEFVKSDIDLYWPKIKPGGLLCGHDYCNSPPHCRVKDAVDDWVRGAGLPLEVAVPCWLVRKPQ